MNAHKLLIMTSAAALFTAIAGPAYADQHEKTVFVTSMSFKGNLGGLTGADDKCQAEADNPGSIVPSGTYLAWLSDGTDSPDTRFTKSSHPYMLPDGTKIADDFTDLTDGSILHAINIDPTGKPLGLELFWTGTDADGTSSSSSVTCNGWMAEPGAKSRGAVGSTVKTSTLWSARSQERCGSNSNKLVCFQQ